MWRESPGTGLGDTSAPPNTATLPSVIYQTQAGFTNGDRDSALIGSGAHRPQSPGQTDRHLMQQGGALAVDRLSLVLPPGLGRCQRQGLCLPPALTTPVLTEQRIQVVVGQIHSFLSRPRGRKKSSLLERTQASSGGPRSYAGVARKANGGWGWLKQPSAVQKQQKMDSLTLRFQGLC